MKKRSISNTFRGQRNLPSIVLESRWQKMFLNQYANNINKKDEKEELKLDKSIQFWKETLFEKAVSQKGAE